MCLCGGVECSQLTDMEFQYIGSKQIRDMSVSTVEWLVCGWWCDADGYLSIEGSRQREDTCPT